MDEDTLFEESILQKISKVNANSVVSDIFSEDVAISDDDQIVHGIPESMVSCWKMNNDRLSSIEKLILEDIISEIEREESQSAESASGEKGTDRVPQEDEDSDEYLEAERQFKLELMNLERRLKEEEEKRMAEHKMMKERLLKERQEEEERRRHRHRYFEDELKRIEHDSLTQHMKLDAEQSKVNRKIQLELMKQQELIAGLQKHVEEERQAFEEVQAKERGNADERRCKAATKIQASVRAFLVRTKNVVVLSERREERRRRKERLEKERKEREEMVRKKLEEERTRQEAERRKVEEERMRQEAERRKVEEERMRQEAERRMREEAERRLERTEQKRLVWMKACIPWTKLSLESKRKQVVKTKIELIAGLQKHEEEEGQTCEEEQVEETRSVEERRTTAATKIQARVRAFLVRRKYRALLRERREESRQRRGEQQQKEEQLRKESSLRQSADDLTSSRNMCLPDLTEQKRLEWMKACVPWTKLSLQNKRKQVVKTKTVRRGSGSSLPPLSTDTILQRGTESSLKQVTTVTLEDLPGCSLCSLSECVRLRVLTVRRCGLEALEGLGGCAELRYIDVQENAIRFVNCQGLANLRVLLLSHNQLTSIHGLEDAANLDVLELSHNRISRISGLAHMKRLQRLLIDHNQLISTKGLRELYRLLHLDCSFNHLTSMEDSDNCALLHTLRLQGNNLTEPPRLMNQVLMRELCLSDNIISSLESLSASWLPLLQQLSVAKNSITRLPPLTGCVSLQRLDISHNCLSELADIQRSLQGCTQLQEIQLFGNPFQQESNWRPLLLKSVPGLRRINGEWISSLAPPTDGPPPGSFLAFCQAQLQQLEDMQARHAAELGPPQTPADPRIGGVLCRAGGPCGGHYLGQQRSRAPCPLDVPAIAVQHCEELQQLAEEQRYAHEFGDVTLTHGEEPESPSSPQEQGPVEENTQDPGRVSRKRTSPPPARPGSQDAGEEDRDLNGVRESADTADTPRKCAPAKPARRAQRLDLRSMAAVVIQSCWRGHRCRRTALLQPAGRGAAGESGVGESGAGEGGGGESAGPDVTADRPSHSEQQAAGEARLERGRAATIIQAVWKGYILRKRLASALAAVRVTQADEDFEEVDMDEFLFDEAALERDWITLDSEGSPPKSLPFCEQPLWPKPPPQQPTQRNSPTALPWQPIQAWPGDESERTVHSRCSISPERPEDTHRTQSPAASGFGELSEKSARILKEWGIRDRTTAHLMLKRAQKMRPKKKKDRKLGDPAVCLDLFRSSENKQMPIKVPKRNHPEKMHPSKAREEDAAAQQAVRSDWTQQWLQAQGGQTGRSSTAVESVSALSRCWQAGPGPRDEPLEESPTKTSTAAVSPPRKEHNQTRADSGGQANKDALGPMQSTSGPVKKERISFRDNPVQLSIGWGGGKKRSKPIK
ncbi:leucine-rich repeat and IQ domain-containing protein 1 [Megalops cyprinoides]|uniref:leucine-rich repeat and IQ domain-containing protein 1 n=1 Tax=Megalops cyprinoides TaxID=118141 RepID=UPI0018648457|nr:leucine-rich repeat and IQ domain-containing protein 1 [Megalops cyprinoides]